MTAKPDREARQARARRRAAAARAALARRRSPPQEEPPPLTVMQARAMAAVLNARGVEYVVIGGLAAQLHGAPVARTRDMDITPADTAANRQRLAEALVALGARLRVAGDPDGVAIRSTPARLNR